MDLEFSSSFAALCACAVPYGLAAGCVNAGLNNYVALHYESRYMSWQHCMWGIGAAGSFIMGHVLAVGRPWNEAYRLVALIAITRLGNFLHLGVAKKHSIKLQTMKRLTTGANRTIGFSAFLPFCLSGFTSFA